MSYSNKDGYFPQNIGEKKNKSEKKKEKSIKITMVDKYLLIDYHQIDSFTVHFENEG